MINYNIHHVNGCRFEITSDDGKGKEYDVQFVDKKDNSVIYETKMKVGTWAKLERRYLCDLAVIVKYKDRVVTQVNYLNEIKGKRVFITFESKALGDTLAWIPYCLKFKEVYQCHVIVSTFKNDFFKDVYPELEFADRGVVVKDLIGMFELGWYWDKYKEPINPVLIPLQQSASNILNLPYEEILPRINFIPKERPIAEKYVCISVHSTSGFKLWHYWQDVIDFLKSKGYKVVEISDVPHTHKSVITQPKYTGLEPFPDKEIYKTMNYIYHSEFFMGLSSGLSWLAWALKKRVYMISNFTDKTHEFQNNCIRIVNESICNSCWNNPMFRFNKGDWNYCAEHEDTQRHFECHKLITSDVVINKIMENEKIG